MVQQYVRHSSMPQRRSLDSRALANHISNISASLAQPAHHIPAVSAVQAERGGRRGDHHHPARVWQQLQGKREMQRVAQGLVHQSGHLPPCQRVCPTPAQLSSDCLPAFTALRMPAFLLRCRAMRRSPRSGSAVVSCRRLLCFGCMAVCSDLRGSAGWLSLAELRCTVVCCSWLLLAVQASLTICPPNRLPSNCLPSMLQLPSHSPSLQAMRPAAGTAASASCATSMTASPASSRWVQQPRDNWASCLASSAFGQTRL